MDETYVKVRGEWMYLYQAVDKSGKTVNFYLSRSRDVNAGVSPMVWRRLLLRSDHNIADLHHAIQISMGWSAV
jgi:hypothetical protein